MDNRQLSIYRLFPVASADDPRWLEQERPGEVLVRAYSPADARIAAAEAELDFPQTDAKPSDGTGTRFASCFRDEKLYAVALAEDTGHDVDGERGVVEGGKKTIPITLNRDIETGNTS